jgi:glycosyltransferase involved in cell wall biosynthesis
VGTLEIRKNGALLLRAWLRLLADLGDQTPMLVFAGRRGWLLDEFDALLAQHPQLQRFVKVVSQPSDQELSRLYSGCLFTVFPSLYEGWGLPIGEAAWFGKFCIASNASSMPEVCGDLIDYVDPNDFEDLYHKVRRAIREPDYIRQREARIKQAPLRSWSDVSRNICAQLLSTDASQTSD